jgi:hypothetical protein
MDTSAPAPNSTHLDEKDKDAGKDATTHNIKDAAQDSANSSQTSTSNPPVISLIPADLRRVCFAIGAPYASFEEPIPKPSSISWNSRTPPAPAGLYASVISLGRRAKYSYYFTSFLYNTLLILQLLFSAANTALAAQPIPHKISLTTLTALTTVNAGIVALLHNSGLPNRLRNDWNEYDKVETFLVEVMSGGVVPAGSTWEDVVQLCFNKSAAAKATVQANKPSFYSTSISSDDSGTVGATSGTGNSETVIKAAKQLDKGH